MCYCKSKWISTKCCFTTILLTNQDMCEKKIEKKILWYIFFWWCNRKQDNYFLAWFYNYYIYIVYSETLIDRLLFIHWLYVLFCRVKVEFNQLMSIQQVVCEFPMAGHVTLLFFKSIDWDITIHYVYSAIKVHIIFITLEWKGPFTTVHKEQIGPFHSKVENY